MNNNDLDKPVDPLDDLDLDIPDLGIQTEDHLMNNSLAEYPKEEIIHELKTHNKFVSREPSKAKAKHKVKTFSFFPEELSIIEEIKHEFHRLMGGRENASDSDVARAAILAFRSIPSEDRARIISANLGRKKR